MSVEASRNSSYVGRWPIIRDERGPRRWLSELAFGVGRAILGRQFTDSFREMQHAQWLPEEQLLARAEARLARLLRHAAENAPFYRETYQRLGLAPDELGAIRDLTRLPIITKTTIREHPPDHFLAANLPPHRRVELATSGSTGEPFKFYLDRQTMPVMFASHHFWDSWFQAGPLDRSVRILAPRASPPPPPASASAAFRLRQWATARLKALYEGWTQEKIWLWEVDGKKAEEVHRRIEAARPCYIVGYTSTLAAIADELLQRNLRLSHQLRAVIVGAETLSPPRRRLIEQCFHAPIINRYGLREFGSWSAQSCSHSPDHLHVNTELVIWEIVRNDGAVAAPGEVGRVLLTNLYNYVMPFIRYDTGDLAVAGTATCPCGRGLSLVGQIDGRSRECIRTPSGKEISPAILGHYLFVYHGYVSVVKHYQLIQEAPDRARLLVVPATGFDTDRHERLRDALARLLGDEVVVTVETVDAIPCEKSGKRPIIKKVQPYESEIKRD